MTFTEPMIAALDQSGATSGTMADATAIINQYLADYGLQNLSDWAWGQITDGATADQIEVAVQQTPQFKARYPGIATRIAKGLPPISPSDYLSYEDQAKQIEDTYGLPTGFLTDSNRIADLIGNDVSASELSDRAQKGYAVVADAPAAVRQQFTAMYGVNGDGALASYFMDKQYALPLLERQATAADIAGRAGMNNIDIGKSLAETMAAAGVTGDAAQTGIADLAKKQDLYQTSVGDQNQDMTIGKEGVEAEFGLDAQAQQDTIDRQQAREAAFKGGGAPQTDQFGASGAGPARPY